MAANPAGINTDLVAFRILADGIEINSSYQVKSIEVRKGLNRIGSARVEFYDGSISAENFPVSDSADFLPGTELTILAGYGTDSALIYKGIIVKHGLEVSANALLVLECRDKAASMTVGRKNTVFADCTDGEAIAEIIGAHGLTATIDATTVHHPSLVQYDCSDWDFVVSRAEANGLVVLSEQDAVTVARPKPEARAVLALTYGVNLLSFAVDLDARSQYQAVKASAWDSTTQAMLEAEAAPPGVTTPGNVQAATLAGVMGETSFDLPVGSDTPLPELQAHANARLLKSALAKVRGTVRFQGSALAVPGCTVELAGMGQRFNGTAYVAGVAHTVAEGNWITEIALGLDEQWFAGQHPEQAPALPGPLPGIQGLYNAVMAQIHQDPAGEFRVQVKVPALQGQLLWARLGHAQASHGSGAFFYPEVGDEVILGFFHNDPQQPVVLGSLYSSSRVPACSPTEENNLKGWTTPSQLTISLEDEQKIITIRTPGGNMVILNDETQSITLNDSHGNKAVLSSSGILLDSATSLTLKAAQNIELTAATGLILTATGDLTMSALNVTAKANVSLKATGNASAELSAAGQTTVKGAIVMIN